MLAAVLKQAPVALTQTLYPLVAMVLEEELMMFTVTENSSSLETAMPQVQVTVHKYDTALD